MDEAEAKWWKSRAESAVAVVLEDAADFRRKSLFSDLDTRSRRVSAPPVALDGPFQKVSLLRRLQRCSPSPPRPDEGEEGDEKAPAEFASVPDLLHRVALFLPPEAVRMAVDVCRLWRCSLTDTLFDCTAATCGVHTCGRAHLKTSRLSSGARLTGKLVFAIIPAVGPFAGQRLRFHFSGSGFQTQRITHPCSFDERGGSRFELADGPEVRSETTRARGGGWTRQLTGAACGPLLRRLVAMLHWNPVFRSMQTDLDRPAGFKVCDPSIIPGSRFNQPGDLPQLQGCTRVVKVRCGSGFYNVTLPPSVCAAEAKWLIRSKFLRPTMITSPPEPLALVAAGGVLLKELDPVPDSVELLRQTRVERPRGSLSEVTLLVRDVGVVRVALPRGAGLKYLSEAVLPKVAPRATLLLPLVRPDAVANSIATGQLPAGYEDGAVVPVAAASREVRVRFQGMSSGVEIAVPAHPSWRFDTFREIVAAACRWLSSTFSCRGSTPWCRSGSTRQLPTPDTVCFAACRTMDGSGAVSAIVDADKTLGDYWDIICTGGVLFRVDITSGNGKKAPEETVGVDLG
eukprot:Hpha_TRINITY_DN4319_c0_g1::TRINITY_DN4319_c0_g1_i2::g.50146::m.50146